MEILAVIAVSMAVGTYLGVRWAEAGQRIDDLILTVLSTPLPDTSAGDARDPGAADTGARAESPLGAGSTPTPT